MITNDELKRRQSLPIFEKIRWSKERIWDFYTHFDGAVYVSLSGGKDSTVLLHIVRSVFPYTPAVFVDTGLEYPEIRSFVRTHENVTWLKPRMSFTKVIEKYGYPVISKEQAQYICEYRTTKSEKLKNIRWNGNKYGQGKISEKWKYLTEAPFKISHKCCDIMKKNPIRKYEKESGRFALIGTMASESRIRMVYYLKNGCNAFELNRPRSMPISIWTEKDIWEYIKLFDVPYSKIYDMGCDRTGCMFCMFGVHLEQSDLFSKNRFQRMKETHPKQWDYCINKLGLGKVLDYINVSYS